MPREKPGASALPSASSIAPPGRRRRERDAFPSLAKGSSQRVVGTAQSPRIYLTHQAALIEHSDPELSQHLFLLIPTNRQIIDRQGFGDIQFVYISMCKNCAG